MTFKQRMRARQLTKYNNFTDLVYDIKTGHVPAEIAFLVEKFGENNDIDQSEEDIWAPGGTMTDQTTGDTIEFLSDNAADDDGSTGATEVQAYFIDANYELQEETITMNGISAVATTGSNYLYCYRAKVTAAGSGNINAGNITARIQTGAQTTAYIAAGQGQTQQSQYIVPAGYSMQLYEAEMAIGGLQGGGGEKKGDIVKKVQDPDTSIWRATQKFVGMSSTGLVQIDTTDFPLLPAKSRLKFTATSEANDTRAIVNWGAVCVHEDYLSF